MRVKREWQDIVLCVTLLITVIVIGSVFATYKHIPGPIYGGDLYRERGFVLHITQGNPFWSDPYFREEIEFYPPFGYLTLALITLLTGLDVNTVMNFSPILVFILKSIALYMLGKTIFHNKTYSLLLVMVGTVISPIDAKVTLGLGMSFVFFALNYLLKVNKDRDNRKYQILLGVFLGLALISHLRTAIYSAVFVISTITFEFFMHKEKIRYLNDTFRRYILSFLVMVGISAVFYVPLAVKYHLRSLNLTQQYSLFDVSARGIDYFFIETLKMFFNLSSVLKFVLGMLAILGVVFAIMNFKRMERRYVLWWIIGAYLAANHYLITAPLFNTWIVPSHVFGALSFPFVILQGLGLYFLSTMLKIKDKHFFIAAMIILVIPGLVLGISSHLDKRWTVYGQSFDKNTESMYELADWIIENTKNDDVFIGNDESMFAINALTGRKVALVRRTHASPYVDVDRRYADAMVMLYGNDTQKTIELIRTYGVTYLFIDSFMLTNPMLTSPEHAGYLARYGVEHSVQNVRLDPSTTNAPSYDYLVVPAQNITIYDIADPVYQVRIDAQTTGLVYKIDPAAH